MAEQSTPFLNAPQSSADVDPNTVRKEEVQEAEPTQQHAAGAARPERAASRLGALVSQVPQPQYMKLANPGPLGLLSFAITTFALGLYECGAGCVCLNPPPPPPPPPKLYMKL